MKIRNGIIVLAVFLVWAGKALAGDIAVIVHPSNPISGISQMDLRRILLHEKNFWKDGTRIFLLMRESGSKEKELLMKRIYRMGDEELKRLWLSKLFKGEIPSPPKIATSDQTMKLYVRQVPSAIGFVNSDFLDDSVKVLRVDGKFPGEEGYILNRP